jgi:hypothetical protein
MGRIEVGICQRRQESKLKSYKTSWTKCDYWDWEYKEQTRRLESKIGHHTVSWKTGKIQDFKV